MSPVLYPFLTNKRERKSVNRAKRPRNGRRNAHVGKCIRRSTNFKDCHAEELTIFDTLTR